MMDWRNAKDRKTFFSLWLLCFALLLMYFTTAELININREAYQAPPLTKETMDQIKPDKEEIQQYLDPKQAYSGRL
ncbi:hypothetical protein ACFL02_06880 [Planctomycetota bacterium]